MEKKGNKVRLSFYAFFKNKNDNLELLIKATHWWTTQHQLDHFEKAEKVKSSFYLVPPLYGGTRIKLQVFSAHIKHHTKNYS